MTRVFADTAFYVALIHRLDGLRSVAIRVAAETAHEEHVTSEPVLVELCNYFARMGEPLRATAVDFVDELRRDPNVEIVRQTPELFDQGLELYRRRPDKGYSLTDCMSMAICRRRRIKRVLTHDRHFAQEGLEILI